MLKDGLPSSGVTSYQKWLGILILISQRKCVTEREKRYKENLNTLSTPFVAKEGLWGTHTGRGEPQSGNPCCGLCVTASVWNINGHI